MTLDSEYLNDDPNRYRPELNDWEEIKENLTDGENINLADIDGNTFLHLAAIEGNEEITRFLLEAGADPNIFNAFGHTPLGQSMASHNPHLIPVLIEFGANPIAEKIHCFSPIYWLCVTDNRKTIEYFFSYWKNELPELVNTILPHIYNRAAAMGFYRATNELLKYRPQLKATLSDAFHSKLFFSWLLVVSEKEKFLHNFVSRKIKTPEEVKDLPAFFWVAALNRAEVATVLFHHGANINEVATKHRWTPLMWAALGGFDSLVQLFLEYGADLNLTDSDGNTALNLVEKHGALLSHRAVMRTLRCAGKK